MDARERWQWDCDEEACTTFRNNPRSSRVAYRSRSKERKLEFENRLRQILITKIGLPEIALLPIQLVSSLLMEGGVLGIEDSSEKSEEDTGEVDESGRAADGGEGAGKEVEWVRQEDVADWVTRTRAELTTDRNEYQLRIFALEP